MKQDDLYGDPDQAPPEPDDTAATETVETAAWHPLRRILFRFVCLYFVLYTFPFPIEYIPFGGLVTSWVSPAWDQVVGFVGVHVFELAPDLLKRKPTGSGDTTYDYVQFFCVMVMSLFGTLLWSLLDRRRLHYHGAARWLMIGGRFFLAIMMLSYGFSKVFYLQFSTPSLSRLVTPYGHSSPMALVWTFMGASRAYTFFGGAGEVIGGLLLCFRRTTTLGALVLIAVMGNVVMLNFAYDIPVKLFSSHLFLIAVGLLAPDAKRLLAFALNRATDKVVQTPLFERPRLRQAAMVFKLLTVAYFLVMNISQGVSGQKQWGVDAPKPPLYGIHDVESFTLDDEERPPLLTDQKRWRSIVFSRPNRVMVQKMDGQIKRYGLKLDEQEKTMGLSGFRGQDPDLDVLWTYEQPAPGVMILQGELDGETLKVQTRERDPEEYLLLNRGFHWIQEYPFNH